MKHIKDKSLPLKVFIHGFSEKAPGGDGSSSEEIRDGNFIEGENLFSVTKWAFKIIKLILE